MPTDRIKENLLEELRVALAMTRTYAKATENALMRWDTQRTGEAMGRYIKALSEETANLQLIETLMKILEG